MQETFRNRSGEGGRAHREGEQDQRRGHGEGEPRGKAAQKAVAAENAEGKADLAGGRSRQKLAERDQVRIGRLVEPFAAHDELIPVIAEMGDRAAEGGQPQLQERRKNLADRCLFRALPWNVNARSVGAAGMSGETESLATDYLRAFLRLEPARHEFATGFDHGYHIRNFADRISFGAMGMTIDRRAFLHLSAATALAGAVPGAAKAQNMAQMPSGPHDSAAALPQGSADHTIRIANGLVELAPDHIVSTKLYNGQFPGPLLRLKEGRQVVVDIRNDTDTPEQLHWHGQTVPVDVDGAAEEGTPLHSRPRHAPDQFCAGAGRLAVLSHPSGARRRSDQAGNIAARSARSTSSRNASPAATTAKCS